MSKISHKITIDAPAGRVFKVLSTADGLKGWYTPHLEGPIQPAGNALKVLARGRIGSYVPSVRKRQGADVESNGAFATRNTLWGNPHRPPEELC